jgi:hypothetical protein
MTAAITIESLLEKKNCFPYIIPCIDVQTPGWNMPVVPVQRK